MKRKTSMTYITGSFRKVWRCRYCDLQYIMKGTDAAYYNAGVYGWNCDIYVDYMHDVAITTGYRNMRGERIPDEVIDEFTARAKKVYEGYDWKSYDEYRDKMNQVRTDFFNRLAEIEKREEGESMKHTKNMIYRPSAESKELLLYTRNTSRIYYNHTLPVLDNLRKKLEKGVYDPEKAVDLWYYVTTAAAKMYNREFSGMYQTTFTVTDRYTAAVELEKFYHTEMLLETT